MSKQAKPPPPGDKPAPSAPPPPPTWRNWLWPIMLIAIFALWFFLPTRSPSTSLSYSQFIQDVQNAPGQDRAAGDHAGRHDHRHAEGREELHRGHPGGQPGAGDPAEQRRGGGHRRPRVRTGLRHHAADLPDHVRAADPALRLAVPPHLPRRGRRPAGRARRGPVPGQGVRRGAAQHDVRRRGRVRGRQVRDRRGGGLPPPARAVHQGRRHGAARRAHGRTARHRQDAAGPRGRRRGARAVLLGHRVRLRRAVRRRRRVPRPRPVRAGPQARARHHLHRRDRRDRPAPGRLGRHRVQRRAGADAQPAAGRDGRVRALGGHRGARGHQPARDPRPGSAPAGAVRPGGHDPAAERDRAGRDPGRALPGQEAGARREPGRHRPRHPRLLRRRPGQPDQRGGHLRGPGQPGRPHRGRLRRGQGPNHPGPPGELQRAAARGEARGGGARVRARPGGRAVRARRPGGQGDDPAGRTGARA